MLISPKGQEVTSMLAVLVRHIVSTEWVINPIKIQLNIYRSSGKGNPGLSSKVKDKLLYFAFFITEKKTTCLVGLFEFWKLPTPQLRILLQPIAKWCKTLPAVSGAQSRKGLYSKISIEFKQPAIWAIQHGRPWVFEITAMGKDAAWSFMSSLSGRSPTQGFWSKFDIPLYTFWKTTRATLLGPEEMEYYGLPGYPVSAHQ